jgi:hypothetical protein
MSISEQRNVGAYVRARKAINPTNSVAATINGPAIDRRGFLSCVLHHACGAATGAPTSRTVDAKLQESADGSTGWTDIAGASATQLTADNSEAEKDVDLSGAKSFIRVVETVAFVGGTAPAIPVAATLTLGGSDSPPV